MTSEVYYLKYRPQKISELDLRDIREQLGQLLSSPNIPHALLFTGPKGLGKTSSARIVAKAINCEKKRKSFEPCNKCGICKSITKGTSLDLIEIDGASNRGIDDIRELKEKINLAPTQAAKKVYVIDEVHMLTKEAFNALLKTLEEPPEHAFFILCTTEPKKLPETIISRCQRFNFTLANVSEIVRCLKRIVKGEKLKVADKVLDLISQKAGGSFRDATKILQQLAFGGKNISLKKAVELLEKETDLSRGVLSSLVEKDIVQALKKLEQAVKQGADLKILAQTILENLRQALLSKYDVWKEDSSRAELSFGEGFEIKEIKKLISIFDQASRQLKGAVIPQLPLELAVLEFCSVKSEKKPEILKVEKVVLTKEVREKTGDDVLDKWGRVLELVKKDNHSVEALLKSTKLKELDKDKLVIEVFYEFHKNKLETDEYLGLVGKRAGEVFGQSLKIEYVLREK